MLSSVAIVIILTPLCLCKLGRVIFIIVCFLLFLKVQLRRDQKNKKKQIRSGTVVLLLQGWPLYSQLYSAYKRATENHCTYKALHFTGVSHRLHIYMSLRKTEKYFYWSQHNFSCSCKTGPIQQYCCTYYNKT